MFLHFSSFFLYVLSFSFIFFVFVGCSKSDFFWASISFRFLLTFLVKKIQFVGPSRDPFGPSFPFLFLPFFPPFSFSFSWILFFFSFFFFFFFYFFFKIMFFFIFIFKYLYQGFTKDVSSEVGAPWRCGVLTT